MTVAEATLIETLEQGLIGGAGLDVTDKQKGYLPAKKRTMKGRTPCTSLPP